MNPTTTFLGKMQLEFAATAPQRVVNVNGQWLPVAGLQGLELSRGLFNEERATFTLEGETLDREIQTRII
jgi:hypothetical protein